MTRFVAMGRNRPPRTGDDKTSICFGFDDDVPGQLSTALEEFARQNINLAKIESRPNATSWASYVFLADMAGHREDDSVCKSNRGDGTSRLPAKGVWVVPIATPAEIDYCRVLIPNRRSDSISSRTHAWGSRSPKMVKRRSMLFIP